jgi:hypothetical protein
MGNLTPSCLRLIWMIRRALEKNQSVVSGVSAFLARKEGDRFRQDFEKWWGAFRAGDTTRGNALRANLNIHQRAVLFLIERGVNGAPIYEVLGQIEKDVMLICEDNIDSHVALLPLRLQVPLMGLIFPAIILLILWPAFKLIAI